MKLLVKSNFMILSDTRKKMVFLEDINSGQFDRKKFVFFHSNLEITFVPIRIIYLEPLAYIFEREQENVNKILKKKKVARISEICRC